MKRSFVSLVVLLACRLTFADSLFDQLAGRFPVLSFDGNENVTGVLELRSDEKEGVGFQVSDLFQPSGEALEGPKLFTPVNGTTFKKEGDQIVQEFLSEELKVRIEYQVKGNNVALQASQCPKGGNCILTLVNTAEVAVEEISATDFFKSVKGEYKIDKVASSPPHDPTSADVAVSSSEANLTFPYCPEAGGICDPGYIDLALKDTKIYRKRLSRTHVIYTIVSDGKKYTWEERGDKIYFRNYQYEKITGEVIVLTHELKKS